MKVFSLILCQIVCSLAVAVAADEKSLTASAKLTGLFATTAPDGSTTVPVKDEFDCAYAPAERTASAQI